MLKLDGIMNCSNSNMIILIIIVITLKGVIGDFF